MVPVGAPAVVSDLMSPNHGHPGSRGPAAVPGMKCHRGTTLHVPVAWHRPALMARGLHKAARPGCGSQGSSSGPLSGARLGRCCLLGWVQGQFGPRALPQMLPAMVSPGQTLPFSHDPLPKSGKQDVAWHGTLAAGSRGRVLRPGERLVGSVSPSPCCTPRGCPPSTVRGTAALLRRHRHSSLPARPGAAPLPRSVT